MDCSLWLNRCKVNSAAEIAEHFDIASLRGYFLGGSLAEWLREHGGSELADRIEALDPADPELNQRLAEIFGKKAAQKPVFLGRGSAALGQCSGSFGSGMTAGSYPVGSFSGSGSFALGSGVFSFGSGVFSAGSYLSGSFNKFHLWEWEWEWRLGGSFRSGSYSFGSYVFGSGAYLLGSGAYLLGSFRGGSFSAGSFGYGSFGTGSFSAGAGLSAEEYDRIMYECLRRCPLNCFGYGIHII